MSGSSVRNDGLAARSAALLSGRGGRVVACWSAASPLPECHDPRTLSSPKSEAWLDKVRSGGVSPQTKGTRGLRTSLVASRLAGHGRAEGPLVARSLQRRAGSAAEPTCDERNGLSDV